MEKLVEIKVIEGDSILFLLVYGKISIDEKL